MFALLNQRQQNGTATQKLSNSSNQIQPKQELQKKDVYTKQIAKSQFEQKKESPPPNVDKLLQAEIQQLESQRQRDQIQTPKQNLNKQFINQISLTDSQKLEKAINELASDDELSQVQPLKNVRKSYLRTDDSKNLKFKDVREKEEEKLRTANNNTANSKDATKAFTDADLTDRKNMNNITAEDSKSVDLNMSEFEDSEMIIPDDLVDLMTQRQNNILAKPTGNVSRTNTNEVNQSNNMKPSNLQMPEQTNAIPQNSTALQKQKSDQLSNQNLNRNQLSLPKPIGSRELNQKYSGISGLNLNGGGSRNNNDQQYKNYNSYEENQKQRRSFYVKGPYQNQDKQMFNEANQQQSRGSQESSSQNILWHYQTLLQQTTRQNENFLQIVQQKDNQIISIIQQQEDYKDKYINSLEQQLKQKDEFLQQMLQTLNQISQRSISVQPTSNTKKTKRGRVQFQEEPEESEESDSQNRPLIKQKQRAQTIFRSSANYSQKSSQYSTKNAPQIMPIQNPQSTESFGFFRGGNLNQKLQIKPENMKKIANLFSDSSENEQSKQKDVLSSEEESPSFKKIMQIKKNIDSDNDRKQQLLSLGGGFQNVEKKFVAPTKIDQRKPQDVEMTEDSAPKQQLFQPPKPIQNNAISAGGGNFKFKKDYITEVNEKKRKLDEIIQSDKEEQMPENRRNNIFSGAKFQVDCICMRQSKVLKVTCEICEDKTKIVPTDILRIFEKVLKPTSEEFDIDWIQNCFNHVIWKLANYSNIDQYHHEFTQGKRTFFQRIVQKDEGCHQHFVGVVASLQKSKDNPIEIYFSDGAYLLKSILKPYGDFNYGDDRIINLIEKGKIFVGQKLNMMNQALIRDNNQHKPSSFISQTKHYFLSLQSKHLLQLNFNGIWRAKAFDKLGQQKPKIMIKNLNSIVSNSGPIPMLDCVVVRKYPLYFTEFQQNENGQSQRLIRNKLSVEVLQQKQIDNYNEAVRKLYDSRKAKDGPLDQSVLDQVRRKHISTFKMMFKIKISDTFSPNNQAIISFFEANEDMYQYISPGDRLRLSNVSPSFQQQENIISLNMVKSSKIFHYTQSVLKPKKQLELIDQYKELEEKSINFQEFKKNYYGLKREAEIQVCGFVLKLISIKANNQSNVQNQQQHVATSNVQSDQGELWKFLILTHEQEILCIEIQDKSFILTQVFPKEGQYIFLDNLCYLQSIYLQKKNTSILTFQEPQTTLSTSSLLPQDNNSFYYDVLKMSVRSLYKMIPANHNESTQTLKLLVKEKSVMKHIESKVKIIINQGIKRSQMSQSQNIDNSEISEI
ncbi:breast cancer type 2 susceptibility protein [Stylonychia lemnae]|uniref:Breast cancer type 2 susceptibility protein n=1 Tax=Stylonychia lemnae TaxID=5949 RepID=A0A078B1M0_STYLE|nr:breast cancer type 2 susceptibility protein [Stylonychia lemnae]|eukprot:CDW88389.1 breast cancer type 2 susceptibility protein [Stylonychia lemnae]